MLPGLGAMEEVIVEVIAKPREEYLTATHAATGLPKAPAIMLNGTVLVTKDIKEKKLLAAIKRHLNTGDPSVKNERYAAGLLKSTKGKGILITAAGGGVLLLMYIVFYFF